MATPFFVKIPFPKCIPWISKCEKIVISIRCENDKINKIDEIANKIKSGYYPEQLWNK